MCCVFCVVGVSRNLMLVLLFLLCLLFPCCFIELVVLCVSLLFSFFERFAFCACLRCGLVGVLFRGVVCACFELLIVHCCVCL